MASQTAESATQNPELLQLLTKGVQLLEKQTTTLEKHTLLLEKNTQLLEVNNKLLQKSNSNTASTSEKASIIEWRQCQLGGEASDAARMTSLFLRGHTTTWGARTRRAILEQIVSKGQVGVVQQRGLYLENDIRRAQLLALVFYKTCCETSEVLYDAFLEHDPRCDELWPFLPSFREEMRQEASKRDNELGDKACGATPEGGHVKSLEHVFASCQIPSELQALYNEILPVTRDYKPIHEGIMPERDASFEEVHTLPEAAKTYFEWAASNEISSSADERVQKTEAIVKWCRHIAAMGKKQKALKDDEWRENRAKYDWGAQTEKDAIDKAFLERRIKSEFPAYHDICVKHAASEAAKQAAKEKPEETAKTNAEGPAAPSEGRA